MLSDGCVLLRLKRSYGSTLLRIDWIDISSYANEM